LRAGEETRLALAIANEVAGKCHTNIG
jgi:hypothetical protein